MFDRLKQYCLDTKCSDDVITDLNALHRSVTDPEAFHRALADDDFDRAALDHPLSAREIRECVDNLNDAGVDLTRTYSSVFDYDANAFVHY